MREVGTFEAKTKLSQLLDEVEAGEEITITRHGRAVALLIPANGGFNREKARRAAAGIGEAARGNILGGLTIKELVDEGRS